MTIPQPDEDAFAIAGGTGPYGTGLALRLAAAGKRVLIGSRAAERATATAERVRAVVPGALVDGMENQQAIARARRVILSLPFAGLQEFVRAAPELEGKLVIDTIAPLVRRRHFCDLESVPGAASVGELLHAMLPRARVVSTLKNLSASQLQNVPAELDADVLVCGADPTARAEVAAVISCIPRLRPVDAGGIENARYVEAITALLVDLNRRHRTHSSIRITGLH